jgi:hypothetical protein
MDNIIDLENDDIMDPLDSSWISEFENLDSEYKDYYTEELTFISINCIYINKSSEIEKIIEEKIFFKTPGIISKEEIIGLIKHNQYCNNIKYSLLSILKININIDPIFLKTFIKNKDSLSNIGSTFLQSIKNIEDIKFDKCISMFHDLNSLIIILHEKERLTNQPCNFTRKIFINSSYNKKTKRNIFKDIIP